MGLGPGPGAWAPGLGPGPRARGPGLGPRAAGPGSTEPNLDAPRIQVLFRHGPRARILGPGLGALVPGPEPRPPWPLLQADAIGKSAANLTKVAHGLLTACSKANKA